MKHEWRCVRCRKLLGVVENGRLYIRFSKGYQYIVGFPANCVCRSCNALNELTDDPLKQERLDVERQ